MAKQSELVKKQQEMPAPDTEEATAGSTINKVSSAPPATWPSPHTTPAAQGTFQNQTPRHPAAVFSVIDSALEHIQNIKRVSANIVEANLMNVTFALPNMCYATSASSKITGKLLMNSPLNMMFLQPQKYLQLSAISMVNIHFI